MVDILIVDRKSDTVQITVQDKIQFYLGYEDARILFTALGKITRDINRNTADQSRFADTTMTHCCETIAEAEKRNRPNEERF